MPDISTPPLPPGLTAAPPPMLPMQRFAAQRAAAGPQQQPQQPTPGEGVNTLAMANELMNGAADNLMKAAQILMVVAPEDVALIQQMGKIGSVLQSRIQEKLQGQSQGGPEQPSLVPSQQGPAAAVSGQ